MDGRLAGLLRAFPLQHDPQRLHEGQPNGGALRPTALYLAAQLPESPSSPIDPAVDRGGWVRVRYGESGNATSVTVRARCHDVSAATACWDDANESDVDQRAAQLLSTCRCDQEQHYEYRWDELNRLAEARRYDRAGSGDWALQVRQRYRYDAGNIRTLKETVDGQTADPSGNAVGGVERVALYVMPGDFERRGLVTNRITDTYDASLALGTETQYLVAGARVVWKPGAVGGGGTGFDRDARVTLAMTNLLQSTAGVVDLVTGSLLEVATYYPNGARETLRANSDVEEFALEPVGFTGKEDDSEVGLVYFGMRYLMPHLGRWASPDPLQIHAGGGGEFGNSYHYVSGNLLQARDPLGLDCEADAGPCADSSLPGGAADSDSYGGNTGPASPNNEPGAGQARESNWVPIAPPSALVGPGGPQASDYEWGISLEWEEDGGGAGYRATLFRTTSTGEWVEYDPSDFNYSGHVKSDEFGNFILGSLVASGGTALRRIVQRGYDSISVAGVQRGFSRLVGDQRGGLRIPGTTGFTLADDVDDFLFRGTSAGYAGNPALQRLGVTPTSTDPLIATLFAADSARYGSGVVLITSRRVVPTIEGNVLSALEAEVGVELAPAVFATRAISIPIEVSRNALAKMGFETPAILGSRDALSAAIRSAPRLTQDQVRSYLNLVQEMLR